MARSRLIVEDEEQRSESSLPSYNDRNLRELEGDLAIQRDHIDECAISHAQDYFHAAEGYALAVARRDASKLDLDREVAKIDRDVRAEAEEIKEKVTEAVVASRVKLDRDYERAMHCYLDACLSADRWRALQDAFRARGDMLRILESHRRGNMNDGLPAPVVSEARERYQDRRGRD